MEQYTLDETIITKARTVNLQQLTGNPIRRRVFIRCPFHQERTASCVIYQDNSFHCFGCGERGRNAIDFIMKMGYSFVDAVNYLTK